MMFQKLKVFGFSLLSSFLLNSNVFSMPPPGGEVRGFEASSDSEDDSDSDVDHSACSFGGGFLGNLIRARAGGAAVAAAVAASRFGKLCIAEVMSLEAPQPLPPYVLSESSDPRTVPPRDPRFAFTVVLDLDETMISARGGGRVRVRPFVRSLLRYLNRLGQVEVIVWTAGQRNHAVNSIYAIGRGVDGAAFRIDHLIYQGPSWITHGLPYQKNLCLLGRSNILLVDDRRDIGATCQGHAVVVNPFHGAYDVVLDEFMRLVGTIASFVSDSLCRGGDEGADIPEDFLACFFAKGPVPRSSSLEILQPDSPCTY